MRIILRATSRGPAGLLTLAAWAFGTTFACLSRPCRRPPWLRRRRRGRRSCRPGDTRRATRRCSESGSRPRSTTGLSDRAAAQPVPTAAALPPGTMGPVPSPGDSDSVAPPAPPPRLPVDTTLIPGRVVQPIDLANALKLAGATELDIATARQRILQAAALLSQARALWMPSLFYGPTWYRSDGQIQTVNGQVQTIDRSALFIGGTSALANTIQGPPPGTGIPSVNGMTSVLRISDAIFEPMAAKARPRREPGGVPDRDQRCAAPGRRGLLQSPGRDRAARHRPRGRGERRRPRGDHRGLRPPGTGPGGRPSPRTDRVETPEPRGQLRQRPVTC